MDISYGRGYRLQFLSDRLEICIESWGCWEEETEVFWRDFVGASRSYWQFCTVEDEFKCAGDELYFPWNFYFISIVKYVSADLKSQRDGLYVFYGSLISISTKENLLFLPRFTAEEFFKNWNYPWMVTCVVQWTNCTTQSYLCSALQQTGKIQKHG